MKSLLALSLFIPALSMAATCYEATAPVPAYIPKTFCLEKLVETNTGDELLVINGNAETPAVLTIKNLSRHNEDRVKFTAAAVMQDVWDSGCGDGLQTTLIVKGEIAYGDIDVDYLNISVEAETTNDTCHSPSSTETYQYLKTKE